MQTVSAQTVTAPAVSRQDVLAGIERIARDHLQVCGEITAQTDVLRDWGLDSLRQLTLVVELENHFRICFARGDEQTIVTVADIARLIELRLGERATCNE